MTYVQIYVQFDTLGILVKSKSPFCYSAAQRHKVLCFTFDLHYYRIAIGFCIVQTKYYIILVEYVFAEI